MPARLNHYSRDGAHLTFGKLLRYLRKDRWLSGQNRYKEDCIKKLKIDCDTQTGVRVNSRDLSQYIAGSAPLHCVDGWNFLGKAIVSHALGDIASSKHFAYYAELRAVISLLASEGIGVFDRKHFEIDALNSTKGPINGRVTHYFADEAFNEWSNSQKSGNLLGEIIRPMGISLNEWFNRIQSGSPMAWIGQNWLNQWGYDLSLLAKDQDARNEASYRPQGFNLKKINNLPKNIALIENFWRMFTPTKNHSFQLDIFLLRRSLREYYKGLGKSRLPINDIRAVLSNLAFTNVEQQNLLPLLMANPNSNDPMLLTESKPPKGSSFYDTGYHIQMICRAALLLRIATGASTKLFEETLIDKDDIEFWWRTIGENHGLWQPTQTDPLLSMWTDVEAALSNINPTVLHNSSDWRTRHSADIITLSGCERIGFAGICI